MSDRESALLAAPVVFSVPPTDSAPVASVESVRAPRTSITRAGLVNALSNVLLATLFFFSATAPVGNFRMASAADLIWSLGAVLMGVFSLVRVPPKTSMVNVRSLAATGGMMLLPSLIRWTQPWSGALYQLGIAVELIGMTFTQLSRVYLGRSFGLFPANRGIVCRGPFKMVRHPIYLGWLLLTLGYVIIYPSARNAIVLFSILPFMMWRIEQEENVLKCDPEYRAYCDRVRYQLLPGIL
jgi:protein-S-isoprenylcysteine O-methyltransferase Ste14